MIERLCFINLILTLVLAIGLMVHTMPEQASVEAQEPLTEYLVPPVPTPEPTLVYIKTIRRARISAYCPCRRCCGRHANGRTAGKTNAWRMVGVATHWDAIPKWRIVDIPGIGKKIVDDNGSAMERSWKRGIYHIDVRMKYHWQARNFGVKYLDVKLYRKAK